MPTLSRSGADNLLTHSQERLRKIRGLSYEREERVRRCIDIHKSMKGVRSGDILRQEEIVVIDHRRASLTCYQRCAQDRLTF